MSIPFHGVINVYKEAGFTSSDVVSKLRGILHMRKIGHTGTLDPDAEGVLPVCLGNGTKLVSFLTDHDKVYRAVCRLGVETDTQDESGTVLRELSAEEVLRRLPAGREDVENVCRSFVGKYAQIPPMYSAVKIGGKKLYELAREGKTVERAPREVEIHEIHVGDVSLPTFSMEVRCSKGTYIRTLCHDIGEKLTTHGTMSKLLRTKVGVFTLENAHRLSEIEEKMKEGTVEEWITPADAFFTDAERIDVEEGLLRLLANGNPLPAVLAKDKAGDRFRVYAPDGRFVALYRRSEKGVLMPEQMFLS